MAPRIQMNKPWGLTLNKEYHTNPWGIPEGPKFYDIPNPQAKSLFSHTC